MGCSCHQQNEMGAGGDLLTLSQSLIGAGSSELSFYVQGVRTGLAIKAAEQAKWQRLGVILALTFGALTFAKHFMNE